MLEKSDLRGVWNFLVLIAPAAIGALIGLRYATEQTPRARAVTWVCSCALGIVAGNLAGESFALSANGVAIVTIVGAATGMELMAGLQVLARGFARDPLGTAGLAIDTLARLIEALNRRKP
jgi:hypothetical protein